MRSFVEFFAALSFREIGYEWTEDEMSRAALTIQGGVERWSGRGQVEQRCAADLGSVSRRWDAA